MKNIITIIILSIGLIFAWPQYEWIVNTDNALEPHMLQNIVRDTSGKFHVTFVSNDKVWYTMSQDGGGSWTSPYEIYSGSNAYLRAGIVAHRYNRPCVFWTVPRSPQYYWPAYRYQQLDNTWIDPIIFSWNDGFAIADLVNFSAGINYCGETDTIYVGKKHPSYLQEWWYPFDYPGQGNHRFQRLIYSPIQSDRICLSIDPLDATAHRFYIYTGWHDQPINQHWVELCTLVTKNGSHWMGHYKQWSSGLSCDMQPDHSYISAKPDPFNPGVFPWKEAGIWGRQSNNRCAYLNKSTGYPYEIHRNGTDSCRSPTVSFTNQGRAFVVAWFHGPLNSEIYYQPECYWGSFTPEDWLNLSNTANTISDEINAAVFQAPAGPTWSPIPPETWAGLLWFENEGAIKKVKFDLVSLPDEIIWGGDGPGGKAALNNNGRKMVIDNQGTVHGICNVAVNDSIYYVCHDPVKPKWIKAIAVGSGMNSSITMTLDGSLLVLWLSNNQTKVYFAKSASGKFSPPFVLAEDPNGRFVTASSVVDNAGMVHFLLEKTSDNKWALQYGTAPVSQTPEPKWRIVHSSLIRASAGNSSIVVNSNCRPYVLYTNPSDGEVYYVTSDGNNITSPQNISESKDLLSTLPALDIYNNQIIALWQEDNGEIYARSKSLTGGPWNPKEKIVKTSTNATNLSINTGNILYDDAGGIYLVRKGLTGWLPIEPFYNSPLYDASVPQLACLEKAGNLTLSSVFTIDGEGKKQILYLKRTFEQSQNHQGQGGTQARYENGSINRTRMLVRSLSSDNFEITYGVIAPSHVNLKVYDINGALVRELINRQEESGNHRSVWNGKRSNGSHLPSGIYFLKLESLGKTETKKLVLVK